MHDKLSYDSYIPTEAPGGTPGWQAPERLQETGLLWLAPSVDIFAVGCVAYAVCTPFFSNHTSYLSLLMAQILTGSPPWKGSPLAEHKVRDGNMPPIAPDEKSLPCNGPAPSAELRELIKRCWALKPEDRPNITAVRSTLLGHHTQ
jgi:serine/threonine protein kinase